uniref:SPRY-associated domain-containing protein n=1 Tax=Astyanax mexicanus TaxID=7994 RepID=A0A8B9GUN7_ASTMX
MLCSLYFLHLLRLSGCNLSAQSYNILQALLQKKNSSLKKLDLSNNDLQDSGVELLSAGLKSPHCVLETQTVFSAFFNHLKFLLATCKLTKQSCENLHLVLQSESSALKELDLSNNDLQDSGVEILSAGLKRSQCKLETLSLNMCKLSEQSCKILKSVLQSENSSLKELNLSKNDLSKVFMLECCVLFPPCINNLPPNN